MSNNGPNAESHTEQPRPVDIFMPVQPELSPRSRLLRPEHRRAVQKIGMVGSQSEETSLNRIIKSVTALYVEGQSLLQQAQELDIGAEILARQMAGHCLVNHDRYHELNGGNPPCNGFGNWLLCYVAAILAPGFSKQVPNAAPGGTFIEGVLWEWMADGDTTVDTIGTKLPKCLQKARLFESICRLFKPLTDIYYGCPELQGHMKKVRHWKDMQ